MDYRRTSRLSIANMPLEKSWFLKINTPTKPIELIYCSEWQYQSLFISFDTLGRNPLPCG